MCVCGCVCCVSCVCVCLCCVCVCVCVCVVYMYMCLQEDRQLRYYIMIPTDETYCEKGPVSIGVTTVLRACSLSVICPFILNANRRCHLCLRLTVVR